MAVEEAVVAPVADGVELSIESLRCNAAEDEFNREVTSIVIEAARPNSGGQLGNPIAVSSSRRHS